MELKPKKGKSIKTIGYCLKLGQLKFIGQIIWPKGLKSISAKDQSQDQKNLLITKWAFLSYRNHNYYGVG
jgi:hypothetical protein